jgi:hypothetical protein
MGGDGAVGLGVDDGLLDGLDRPGLFEVATEPRRFTSVRLFPSWYLGRNPGRSVIVVTYGQDLGDDHGRAVRNFLADPVHTAVFPACKLSRPRPPAGVG